MAQAIVTKYLGPTNTRGGRVKATAAGGSSVTIPWDHGMTTEGNHREAARRLAFKMGWLKGQRWHTGAMPGGGYVFVGEWLGNWETPSEWVAS